MKLSFPVGIFRQFQPTYLGIFTFGLLAFGACSKSDVQVMAPPVITHAPASKTAAERVVEIDRLLAVPLTGSPEEADRRSALRAEREALITSGQVPYRPQSLANRSVATPPNNTVTQRSTNGDVMNYAAPTAPRGQTTVAPNSQASNLAFLEQMTPTEREHYYKTLRLQNTRRVEVYVRHR